MKKSYSPSRNSTNRKLRKQLLDWEIRNIKLASSFHSNVAVIVSSGVHLKWSPVARFPFRFPRLIPLKGLTMDSMCTSTLMTDLNKDPLQRHSNYIRPQRTLAHTSISAIFSLSLGTLARSPLQFTEWTQ